MAELLESETNGSMLLGAEGAVVEPLTVTAAGSSVLVAVGDRGPVLIAVSGLRPHGTGGPRALAEGCDRALRSVHGLPEDYVPTLAFDVAANAARFRDRLP